MEARCSDLRCTQSSYFTTQKSSEMFMWKCYLFGRLRLSSAAVGTHHRAGPHASILEAPFRPPSTMQAAGKHLAT